MILDNIGEAGQKKRKVYQRRLPEDPSKDYYYIIRETSPMESVLVEYGFIDNSADQKKLQNNLEDYVEGVVKAIAEASKTIDYLSDVRILEQRASISGDKISEYFVDLDISFSIDLNRKDNKDA